ncbi:MAG: hypothetical protein JWN63_831 [Candidatus Acidoferrum typicum]|nr:hypothetical protein [Candidatus Acidoferrum typicum]
MDGASLAYRLNPQQEELTKLCARTSNGFFSTKSVWKCKCILTSEKEAHMKPIGRIAVCTVLFLFALGTAFAQQVKTDFDHQANFSQYKTYSWQEVKPANSLWDARIKSAVDAQLAAKGWTQVDSGGDVAIVAIKTTQTQKSLQTFYDGMGGGWGWRRFGGGGFGEATTTEQDYKEGTLVVDLYDAKTKQLIWRGSAEDTLSSKENKNEKNLDKGVAKMFKKFPPNSANS